MRCYATVVNVERRMIYLDLLRHAVETGKTLPVKAEVIVDLEMCGWIVDLETGALCRNPERPRRSLVSGWPGS